MGDGLALDTAGAAVEAVMTAAERRSKQAQKYDMVLVLVLVLALVLWRFRTKLAYIWLTTSVELVLKIGRNSTGV